MIYVWTVMLDMIYFCVGRIRELSSLYVFYDKDVKNVVSKDSYFVSLRACYLRHNRYSIFTIFAHVLSYF